MLSYELFPRGVTVTVDIYCQQQKRLADPIQEKTANKIAYSDSLLLHDNATRGATVDWDFWTSDLVKNPDGTDI